MAGRKVELELCILFYPKLECRRGAEVTPLSIKWSPE